MSLNREMVISEDNIASMKAGNKPSAKLYNWNLLVKELAKIDIEVDSDTKSLIVAGDTEFIYEILHQVYSYDVHIADEPNHINKPKEPKPSDGVDIMNLDLDKELMQTDN